MEQLQISYILLLFYTKFHKFSIRFEKDIAFDITPFEKKSNISTYSLFSYDTINPPYDNWGRKNHFNMSQCNSLEITVGNITLTIKVISSGAKKYSMTGNY